MAPWRNLLVVALRDRAPAAAVRRNASHHLGGRPWLGAPRPRGGRGGGWLWLGASSQQVLRRPSLFVLMVAVADRSFRVTVLQ